MALFYAKAWRIEFFSELKEKNFPAVHHSAEYEKLYRSAYRVISLVLCPEFLPLQR